MMKELRVGLCEAALVRTFSRSGDGLAIGS
jgi:hypothetical protein